MPEVGGPQAVTRRYGIQDRSSFLAAYAAFVKSEVFAMVSIRSWMIMPILCISVAYASGSFRLLRAEDEEPTFRGKKLSEWIEQLQNGKELRDRQAGLIAVQLIGPRKSRKVTQALIAAVRENTEENIRARAALALGSAAAKALGEMKGRTIGAVDVLALALKDADAGTRTEAARSLRLLGRNADEALAEVQNA